MSMAPEIGSLKDLFSRTGHMVLELRFGSSEKVCIESNLCFCGARLTITEWDAVKPYSFPLS